MTLVALMLALMAVIAAFERLFPISFISITLLGLPVAIAGCVFGPWIGLLMGFCWGTVSFVEGAAFGLDGGAILLAYNPFGLVFTCYFPRMLAGFLGGLFYDINRQWDSKGRWSALISSGVVSLTNTVFFVLFYALFFFGSSVVQNNLAPTLSKMGHEASNPFLFFVYFIVFLLGWNFLIEISVNMILGTSCVFGVERAAEKMNLQSPFKRIINKRKAVTIQPESEDKAEEKKEATLYNMQDNPEENKK